MREAIKAQAKTSEPGTLKLAEQPQANNRAPGAPLSKNDAEPAAKTPEEPAPAPAVAEPNATQTVAAEDGKPAPEPDKNAEIDEAAHQAATSPKNDLPEPTEAQKKAGNYPKGHVDFQGIDVSVESPRGSVRTGKDKDGKAWKHTMSDHYGYARGTTGADGEQVDIYVGPKADAPKVFIVDQLNQADSTFDEHKAMAGLPGFSGLAFAATFAAAASDKAPAETAPSRPASTAALARFIVLGLTLAISANSALVFGNVDPGSILICRPTGAH